MVRIARNRVADLFALAEREARGPQPELADRYVVLARRIGMRYNVRLLREYRELYCRGCSAFWVEGRTVRTRMRAGRRVRTCLRCGRQRREWREPSRPDRPFSAAGDTRGARREEGALLEPVEDGADLADEGSEEE